MVNFQDEYRVLSLAAMPETLKLSISFPKRRLFANHLKNLFQKNFNTKRISIKQFYPNSNGESLWQPHKK
jgi:hypothetical protein